jgi:hypothetical protein
MFRRALAFTFCLLSTTVVFAQTKSPVEGVWRVSEVVTTGANAATNSNPQPSVIIFTRGHYSQIAVTGAKPRPPVAPAKDPQKLTDAEKIARFEQWAPFVANSGTYEIKGVDINNTSDRSEERRCDDDESPGYRSGVQARRKQYAVGHYTICPWTASE